MTRFPDAHSQTLAPKGLAQHGAVPIVGSGENGLLPGPPELASHCLWASYTLPYYSLLRQKPHIHVLWNILGAVPMALNHYVEMAIRASIVVFRLATE